MLIAAFEFMYRDGQACTFRVKLLVDPLDQDKGRTSLYRRHLTATSFQ